MSIKSRTPSDNYIEAEVSYLLDKQQDLKKTLNKYNSHVSNFEEIRNQFLNQLMSANNVDKLNEVVKLFDKVVYVDIDSPDFVVVDVPDQFDGVVDVEKEYCVVGENEGKKQKKLDDKTVSRILQTPNITTKDDIYRSVLSNKKNHIVFTITDNGLILNNKQYTQINNNGKPESILDYSDQIFNLIKQHCQKQSTVDQVHMVPKVNTKEKSIIYSWA